MKIFTGKVVSRKMEKTATVEVERVFVHPVYNKRIKKVKKYQVHDDFACEVGSQVKFVACKPISKSKKWRIVKITDSGGKAIDKKTGVKKPLKIVKKPGSKKD